MATNIGIGFSNDPDIETAAQQAAFRSKTQLASEQVDFAIIFSTIHYAPNRTLPAVQKVLKPQKVIGSSTTGIILADSIETRGIAVLSLRSDEIKFGIGSINNIHTQNPHNAGFLLAEYTLGDFGSHRRQSFVFFTDGHLQNTSPLLKGIQDHLGNAFPIIGAGSSDDFHFRDTFQLYQNYILSNSAVGVMLGGVTLNVGIGARHGWRPLGKPRFADETKANVIQRIDGKKASFIYEEYFGEDAQSFHKEKHSKFALLYPLGIAMEGNREYLVKNVVDVLDDGSIVCQGDIEPGSEVHIMIGNKDFCQAAASQAAQEAKDGLEGKRPKLILILESMSRLKLLGRLAHEEIKKVREVFGDDIPIIGMYTNGEICPYQTLDKFKKPHIQNESIVVIALG